MLWFKEEIKVPGSHAVALNNKRTVKTVNFACSISAKQTCHLLLCVPRKLLASSSGTIRFCLWAVRGRAGGGGKSPRAGLTSGCGWGRAVALHVPPRVVFLGQL